MEQNDSRSIKIKVIPLYPLNREVKEGWRELPSGCTIGEMLLRLGFSEERAKRVHVLVEGKRVNFSTPLESGWVVALMPTFAGG